MADQNLVPVIPGGRDPAYTVMVNGQTMFLRGVTLLDNQGNPVSFSGGGGGGAVTVADGADAALGAKADPAYTGSGASTLIGLLKGVYAALFAPTPAGTNAIGTVGLTGNATGTRNAFTTTNVDQIGGSIYTLGVKASAASAPVALATDGLGSKTLPATYGGIQESFKLVASNTPSAATTLYGGDYVFTQTGTTPSGGSYGTVNLQVIGPDGSTPLTVASYTAPDTNGHGMSFGANAKVQVTVSGTTGVNAVLSRVPN